MSLEKEKLEREKAEFRKQFKEWVDSEITKGAYKSAADACRQIAYDELKVSHKNSVHHLLYGEVYPVQPHFVEILSELTGINPHIMNPDVWKKYQHGYFKNGNWICSRKRK